MNLPKIPNLNQAARFGDPMVPGFDVIEGSLFDYMVYPTAGSTQFQFFALPQGQGLSSCQGFAGNAKTPQDTNMKIGGQLATGYNFLVQAVEVDFEPGSVSTASTFTPLAPQEFAVAAASTVQRGVADVNALRVGGGLVFNVSSKEFINDAPLGLFPPMNKLNLDVAVASNSATVGEVLVAHARFGGRAYSLNIPRFIGSGQQFSVTLNFPAVVATPSGFNGRIGVRLRGLHYRPVQ